MKEVKTISIEEIITLAFRKYKLSGKKSMNTFIFTQTKKLSEEDYDKILDTLEKKIKEYEEKKKQKADEEIQKEISKIRILGVS
ncbi:MAG: hypothetical protein HFJ55_04295 [Clostridia bacterium]|jgi:hypothetical protein|nr:hypothetical protein [Clostridia bacterium]